jgi:hypothetical protein
MEEGEFSMFKYPIDDTLYLSLLETRDAEALFMLNVYSNE